MELGDEAEVGRSVVVLVPINVIYHETVRTRVVEGLCHKGVVVKSLALTLDASVAILVVVLREDLPRHHLPHTPKV
jgi:hypothetical protein